MNTTAEQIRSHDSAPVFSMGFRPFFLGASIWAALAVPIWITSLSLGHADIGGTDGQTWHMDEMMFGFLPAIIAGFLLTAIPNWTGRKPVAGHFLAMLFALWVAGRAANLAAGLTGPVGLAIDLAFLPVFAAIVWREILMGKNARNLPVCVLVTLLAAAHIAFHLSESAPFIGRAPERAALGAVAMLIALIGGRIVPAFTRNWLAARGRPPSIVAAAGRLDMIVLALTGAALTAWVVFPEHAATGVALIVAGAATIVRLSRWRGIATTAEGLVWILHVGYAWLGAAIVLIGASVLAPDILPPTAGIHALTAGAVGVMVLAVMSRATRGHTGRPLHADPTTCAIYALINVGALVRVSAPLLPSAYVSLLVVSAVLWAAAFALFAIAYGTMLLAPRPQPA